MSTTISKADYSTLPEYVQNIKSMLGSKNTIDNDVDFSLIRNNLFIEAENGCAHAHYLLGKIHLIGFGNISKDLRMAKLFFQHGIDKEDPAAMRELALLNNQQGLLEKAASLGDVKACMGVAKKELKNERFEKASAYFEKAAAMGSIEAEYQIARVCQKEYRIRERSRCSDWKNLQYLNQRYTQQLEKAASFGHVKAIMERLKNMGNGLDEKTRRTYWQILADNGKVEAYGMIAQYYIIEKNYEEAFKYLSLANKHTDNMKYRSDLADLYERGLGCQKSITQARKLYFEVAQQWSNVEAACKYILLSEKINASIELPIKIKKLEAAAKNNHRFAAYTLYKYYSKYTALNGKIALEYLLIAADQRDVKAMRDLGIRYSIGDEFVNKDYLSAIAWLKLAAQRGSKSANAHLGKIFANDSCPVKNDDIAKKYNDLAVSMGYNQNKVKEELDYSGSETTEGCESSIDDNCEASVPTCSSSGV